MAFLKREVSNEVSNVVSIPRADTYKEAGVDTDEAERGLSRLTERIMKTWPAQESFGGVKLDIGYFANVIDIGGVGLAVCTDGVGSKAIIAKMLQRYDTIGIDCIAMNVNDLICVGARPISMVDYIAIDQVDEDLLDAIAIGLCAGAQRANISISGGEIAQLKDIVSGFDIVGMAVGTVPLDKIVVGQDIVPGDVLIGIESNGIHSNGLTLARRAFFELNQFQINEQFNELESDLGTELLRPTEIYVREVLEVLDSINNVKALVHITSDGFLNLARVASDVGFVIDALPQEPPIFSLIREYGQVDLAEMFEVYNMGIGFCIVVDSSNADDVLSIVNKHGKVGHVIGHAVADPDKRVQLKRHKLVGQGKRFREI